MVFYVVNKLNRRQIVCQLSTATLRYPKPGKHSYLSIPGQVPLLEATIGNLVDKSAALFPEKPAIVVSSPTEVRKTYQQLKKEVSTKTEKMRRESKSEHGHFWYANMDAKEMVMRWFDFVRLIIWQQAFYK